IEYGSLSCSHCAAFSAEGAPALKERYVKTGKVSFEFRNFVRDPYDLTAALLSRCGGTGPFFKLTEQLFADQPNWLQRFVNMSPDDQKRVGALPPQLQFAEIAKIGMLDQFVQQRGIGPEKAA